jgi:HSP20 family protein
MANTQVEVRKDKTVSAANANFGVFETFRREMDRMFDRLSDNFAFPSLRDFPTTAHFWPRLAKVTAPMVDMSGDEKAYHVSAELPGIDDKDVELTVGDDYLFIKAEKRQAQEDKAKDHFVAERSYGMYQRTFGLPADVDRNAIDAKFAKGVLTITLPKTAKAKASTKKIEVKAA